MQTNPQSAQDDNWADDEFEHGRTPENIERGTQDAKAPTTTGHTAGEGATLPNTSNGTPDYGDFGHADPAGAPSSLTNSRPAGVNPGGTAAPSYAEPDQRGSVPQNLDPEAARAVQDAGYEEQRAGWAKDDPRYGGGTRNWATNEPANPSTGPAADDNAPGVPRGKTQNDGSNDNPDEFSALRPDGGQGIPGK